MKILHSNYLDPLHMTSCFVNGVMLDTNMKSLFCMLHLCTRSNTHTLTQYVVHVTVPICKTFAVQSENMTKGKYAYTMGS